VKHGEVLSTGPPPVLAFRRMTCFLSKAFSPTRFNLVSNNAKTACLEPKKAERHRATSASKSRKTDLQECVLPLFAALEGRTIQASPKHQDLTSP
jgi:hypothetical protein